MDRPISRRFDDRPIQNRNQRDMHGQALVSEVEPFAQIAARLRATMQLFSLTSAELIRVDRDRDSSTSAL